MGHAQSHFRACFSSRRASCKSIRKRNAELSIPHTPATYGSDHPRSPSILVSSISASNEPEQFISPTCNAISATMKSEQLMPLVSDSEYPENSWARLPSELVVSIAEKLFLGDNIRLRAVCRSWSSALAVSGYLSCSSYFPWLMLLQSPYTFLSLSDNWTYHFPTETECAECLGSKDGWLIILHRESESCLFNPITRSKIELPLFIPNVHIRKIVLSDTDGSNFVIVVLYGLVYYRLAFMKVGETNTSWARLHLSVLMEMDRGIEDVAYHNGMFFAVSCQGQIEAFNINGSSPERLSFPNSYIAQVAMSSSYTGYLVSSFGDLLHVWKERDSYTRTSTNFVVMKFNPEMTSCWEEVEDLGTQSLFVDSKHSMSLCSSEVKGMTGNCIYFTNEHLNDRDEYVGEVGVFDIGKNTIQPCFAERLEFNCSQQLPLIWFKPSLP